MSQSNSIPAFSCLRCSAIALRMLPESMQEVAFFECPSCLRHYACMTGGSLTYRWLHPVSLALYGVLFKVEPLEHAQRIAEMLVRNRQPEKIAALVEEIELELDRPTQQVREILGNHSSETECREFLAAVVHEVKERLPQSDTGEHESSAYDEEEGYMLIPEAPEPELSQLQKVLSVIIAMLVLTMIIAAIFLAIMLDSDIFSYSIMIMAAIILGLLYNAGKRSYDG